MSATIRTIRPAARRVTVAAAGFALAACSSAAETLTTEATDLSVVNGDPGVHRQYGTPVKLGEGRARTYVVIDQKAGGAPLEVGVALDERALDGLPLPGGGQHGAHGEMHEYILQMPQQNATPFQFVELDWNPGGHEPPGVYDVPHFDFHFYVTTKAQRDAIDPATNPDYAAEGNRLPAPQFVPQFNIVPVPPGTPPVVAAVPRMGVHMIDARSPEVQRLLGNPQGYRPFTNTFIHGSWNGQVTFWEPMITRAYILGKKTETDAARRDEVIPLPLPAAYQAPGHYPKAYRITWDARAREYRIALTQLQRRG